jgi:AcrR family transcriptional regulator
VPRAGLSAGAVTDAALALIDGGGAGALTLAAVAKRAGVATPSLYKHVPSLAALRDLVALRVVEELRARMAAAVLGCSRDEALRAAMLAYRAYVLAYPARYGAVPQAPPADPVLAEVTEELLDVVLAVLRGYGLDGAATIHATRCLRAAAHGFASLQAAGGFGRPEDLDESYAHLVDAVIGAVRALSAHPPGPAPA